VSGRSNDRQRSVLLTVNVQKLGRLRSESRGRRHSSEFHNAPMPYSVFFNGGDAFHQDSVTVRSHGCVHLTQPAARTFYNTLHVGDEVQVVG
jgi:lipoprotein-anchoring transpeptidase ErfK/SrfK